MDTLLLKQGVTPSLAVLAARGVVSACIDLREKAAVGRPDPQQVKHAIAWEFNGASTAQKEKIKKCDFSTSLVIGVTIELVAADLALETHRVITHEKPVPKPSIIFLEELNPDLRPPTPPPEPPPAPPVKKFLQKYSQSEQINRANSAVQTAVDVLQDNTRGELEAKLRRRGVWQSGVAVKRNIETARRITSHTSWEQVTPNANRQRSQNTGSAHLLHNLN